MDIYKHDEWHDISRYCYLGEDFIRENKDKLYWRYVVMFQPLSESLIDDMKLLINFNLLPRYQLMSEALIEKYRFYVDWKSVSTFQKLSEEFIEKHSNDVFWDMISKHQDLSEEFINRNSDKVDWKYISMYQNLTDDFIEKNSNNISKEELVFNPRNRDLENIKKTIVKSRLYTCYDDYFIAYKAIRLDRYSFFNFTVRYDIWNEYTSRCDCSPASNSFGINVGTFDEAKSYGEINGRYIISKCKIKYEDVGRVSNDFKKIRCFKVKIID